MAEITKNRNGAGNNQVEQVEKAKAFGAYLRELRKSQKLNQADLAQRIEVTAGYYGIFEQGRQIPSLKIINRLAQALDIDYLELAMRAGYDEMEARKKEMYRAKDTAKVDTAGQDGHQDGIGALDEDGSGLAEKTNADTPTIKENDAHGSMGATPSSNPTSPLTTDLTSDRGTNDTRGANDAGLDQPRLDWAMGCISRDPTYKLSEQFTQGVLPVNIKALVIQLYQAQTGRQILTAEESAALNQMLHG